ncbi:Spherulation-specific family 4 [Legionella busanensis]|uniref:Spherulation-specific family 4 n=1 Tax=Legionella busanensis TaxID=190655 RepID=A0A378JNA8_9GAMM|nr:spherulation-specific family 4 protein [Legionella busanensis]STX51679.1 Spherulation-specific family 4 [Legionella busanensis]
MSLKKISVIFLFLYVSSLWSSPLPDNLIINPKASADANVITFSYEVTTTQDFYRVYIDVQPKGDNGFPQGGLMANYLIENQTLYKYVGPGWNWTPVKAVSVTSGNVKTWVIQREDILPNKNCAGSLDYLYQVESPAGISSLTKMTLSYPANSNCNDTSQKIAVPSYFYPCTGTANCYWDQLIKGAPTANIALINPFNGPGSTKDPAYAAQVVRSHNAGQSVLGYVYTSYGQRSLTAIRADINRYYNWYQVDGIFFDEGFSENCTKFTYYQNLNNYVKAKGGKAITIVNFGTSTPECYINTTDILVTFESNYNAYLNWRPSGWETKYPASRFWHLLYATPYSSLTNAISLTKQRHAGWVYITPDALPNPWDTLPGATYWAAELSGVSQQ